MGCGAVHSIFILEFTIASAVGAILFSCPSAFVTGLPSFAGIVPGVLSGVVWGRVVVYPLTFVSVAGAARLLAVVAEWARNGIAAELLKPTGGCAGLAAGAALPRAGRGGALERNRHVDSAQFHIDRLQVIDPVPGNQYPVFGIINVCLDHNLSGISGPVGVAVQLFLTGVGKIVGDKVFPLLVYIIFLGHFALLEGGGEAQV